MLVKLTNDTSAEVRRLLRVLGCYANVTERCAAIVGDGVRLLSWYADATIRDGAEVTVKYPSGPEAKVDFKLGENMDITTSSINDGEIERLRRIEAAAREFCESIGGATNDAFSRLKTALDAKAQ
jgi:hypothetical protein